MKFAVAIIAFGALVACSPAPSPAPPPSDAWLPFQRGLPTQSTVLALAVDPRDSAHIFAGTYDTTGIYATVDGARSWSVFDAGLGGTPVLALLYAGNSLLAGTGAGLYRLQDQAWTRVDAIPAVAVYSIVKDIDGPVYAATDTDGIFASADSGSTWAHIPGLDGEIALSVGTLDARTFFVGTSGHGAFVTHDRGETWQSLDAFKGDYVPLVSIDPRDGRSIYLRTRGGLFRSRDAGLTWQRMEGGIESELVNAVLFDPFSNQIYVATSGRGVFASGDDGASWQNLNAGLPPGVATLALAQIDAQTLLAGTQTGVYISRDTGRSLSAASEGLGVPQVHALALDPVTGALLTATETGLYRSTETGAFEQIGSESMHAPILAVALAPDNPRLIYAGGFRRGIFVSGDGGTSWNAAGDIFNGRLSPTGLVVDPQNDQNVFARVLYERIYKSAEGGRSWHAVWTGMPDTAEVETMSIAPSDPSRMYAGTNDGVYVSQDAGESWTLRGLNDQTVLALWIDPRNAKAALAGATDGLYRSEDGGDTWTPGGLTQMSIAAFARDARGNFYAGSKYNGVWFSRDDAKTWMRFGLDGDSVTALAVDDARGAVYAATARGIFKTGLNR
jgi:photosystem II stability/assembly factor-like uncharacterized protein